jgi:hypothetical protein
MEAKCLCDDVMILRTAIEQAIIKGQKSLTLLSHVPEPTVVSEDEYLGPACADECPGVVGWAEDF